MSLTSPPLSLSLCVQHLRNESREFNWAALLMRQTLHITTCMAVAAYFTLTLLLTNRKMVERVGPIRKWHPGEVKPVRLHYFAIKIRSFSPTHPMWSRYGAKMEDI
jgi:hypothetical protein